MKNFSELLDTKFYLQVDYNGQRRDVPLLRTFRFPADAEVSIDGIEVLPRFWHLSQDGFLVINEPFYQWLHKWHCELLPVLLQ